MKPLQVTKVLMYWKRQKTKNKRVNFTIYTPFNIHQISNNPTFIYYPSMLNAGTS